MRKEEKGLAWLRRSCLKDLGCVGGGGGESYGLDADTGQVVGGLR